MTTTRITRWLSRSVPGRFGITIRRKLRVPMDDGVELLADLITPTGQSDPRLPTIVIRGPYGRSGPVAAQARALAREGFTVLFQSCRGTWGSGGVFTPQVDEQRDGIATHQMGAGAAVGDRTGGHLRDQLYGLHPMGGRGTAVRAGSGTCPRRPVPDHDDARLRCRHLG